VINEEDLPKKAAILQLKKAKEPTSFGVIFQNWTIVGTKESKRKGPGGKEVPVEVPVYLGKKSSELVDELKGLLPNFINLNGDLTELRTDPKTGYLMPRESNHPDKVEAALNAKDIPLDFRKNVEGAVRWVPVVLNFKDTLRHVTRVTKYPSWPKQDDHLVLAPGIEPEATGALDRLLDFFCPLTDTDRQLLKALFCTPAWSTGQGKRPLFLIAGPEEADSNVSIGKTTLVDILIKLYESGASLHPEVSVDRLTTNLMNIPSQQVIMIDNVKSKEWSSAALERLITSPEISGHKMYLGYTSFPNHFTFVVTINDPHLSVDLASRAVVIRIRPPEVVAGWRDNIDTFLDTSRIDVFKDIGSILMSPRVKDPDIYSSFRFPIWKSMILNKIDANLGEHIKIQSESLKVNNEWADWLEFVIDKATRYTCWGNIISASGFQIFVQSRILQEWYHEWSGTSVRTTSRGELGKRIKKLCLDAGMLYTSQVKINGDNRNGFWVNPKQQQGPRVAVTTQHKENSGVTPFRS